MDDPAHHTPHLPQSDPRARTRRLVTRLLVLDALLVLGAVAIWLSLGRGDEKANVVNDGLRGSKPPAGQLMPDLSGIAAIDPDVPSPRAMQGTAVALVVTCIGCRSGDIIGGYLGRLEDDDVPDGAELRVVAWDGDAAAWRAKWKIDQRIRIHAVPQARVDQVRATFGIGPVAGAEESGIVYLYDPRRRWRSTFFIGQLDREDIRHDLEALAG